MLLSKNLIAAAALLGMSTAAFAVPVSGQFSLGGFVQAVGSTNINAATGMNFANASGTSVTGTSGLLSNYGAGSGSFASLGACGNTAIGCGTIKNISSFASIGTISQFFTLSTANGSTVSFDLTSITNVSRPGSDAIGFLANGFINFSGFDRTAGLFSLSAQGNSITSFSATTLAAAATNVPEPTSMAILGGSVAVIGLIRRKKA